MDGKNISRLTREVLEKHENNNAAAYATVCNQTFGPNPDETLLSVKRELEHLITLDVMEEYGWAQTDSGKWRYVSNGEFWADVRRRAKSQPTGTEKMEFVFNDEKARALGYSAQACYEAVDRLFARYGIEPVAQGVYEAPDNQNSFTAFGMAQKLPYTDWFLKVIDKWTASNYGGEPEDCLEIHYRIKERNKQKNQNLETDYIEGSPKPMKFPEVLMTDVEPNEEFDELMIAFLRGKRVC